MNSLAIMSKAFKRFYSSATDAIIELMEETSSVTATSLHFRQNRSIQHAVRVY